MPRFNPKDPRDIAPFTADFVWLLPAGDSVTAATVTTAPPDLTVVAVSFQTTQVTVWLGGGADGFDYELVFAIDTSSGVHEVRQADLLVTSEM